MPFSGPSSYLETIDEFIEHWTDVNVALGLSPLVLPTRPYNLASLQADRTSLSNEITALIAAINEVGIELTATTAKWPSRRRYGNSARSSGACSRLPPMWGEFLILIREEANPGKWLIAMRDHKDIWTDINAAPPSGFTPPPVLSGGYTLANFATDSGNLETTFQNLTQGELDVDREVEERDTLYLSIRANWCFIGRPCPGDSRPTIRSSSRFRASRRSPGTRRNPSCSREFGTSGLRWRIYRGRPPSILT